MKYKVKIKKLPTAQTGQQVNYGMYNPLATMGGKDGAKPQQPSVRKTIGSVPREEANLEAEGGETVLGDLTGMSIPQHYTITGPRHAQGGVPLNLPDDSFIFSDFNQMKINDPDILAKFGKAVKKQGKEKGFTPADLAKQYDINKYIKILQDPNSDVVDRKTAELMIKNYNLKLGALAIAQEAKKGFENGVPEVSMPYMKHIGITERDLGVVPKEVQEIAEIISGLLNQGLDIVEILSNLIRQDVAVEIISEALIEVGLPQEEIQQIINDTLNNLQNSKAPQQEQQMAQEVIENEEMMTPEMMLCGGQPKRKLRRRQEGGIPPEAMQQTQDPMQQVMDIAQQMLSQGADGTQVAMELINQGLSPEDTFSVLSNLGMPQEEAQAAIQQVLGSNNPETAPQPQMPMARMGMELGGYDLPFAEPELFEKDDLIKAQKGYDISTSTNAFGEPIKVSETDLIEDVETMQKSRPGSGFGKKVQDITKFMDVHKWYFDKLSDEQKKKFIKEATSGKSSSMVKEFQTSYNKLLKEEAKKRNLSEEEVSKIITEIGFTDKGPQKLDGKFGAFSSSRPYFNFEKPAETPKASTTTVTPEEKKPSEPGKRPDITDIPEGVREGIMPAEWTTPDLLNYYGALADRYSIKKYYPWAARFSPEVPEPVFMDPTRELAAQSEQANILTQAMGQFAGPQALSARASSIQGQGAKQAADTLSRYNQSNVGIANQFAGMEAQIRNQAQQYNLNQAKQLYDQGIITNQQYDNAVRQAKANFRQGFAQGWEGASNIAVLNASTPQYNIAPRTGTVYFTEGKTLTPNKAQTYEDLLSHFKNQFGMTNEEAIKAAKNAMGTSDFAQQGGMVLGSHVFPFMFY